MHRLICWYHRLFDQTLKRPVILTGDRDSLTAYQWNQKVGNLGEELARRFLWSRGLKVLYQRYRAPGGGEVDIVARDRKTLVFCEVKTRTSTSLGRPADAVNLEKRRLITRGANRWLKELGFIPENYRFDIVEVVLRANAVPEINHLKDQFHPETRLERGLVE